MQAFEIIFQDEHFVAINKPAGYAVHAPELGNPYYVPRNRIILGLLRDQLAGTYLYPVHRLDHATTGVLVYAKTKEAASGGSAMLSNKKYMTITRGFIEGEGVLDRPLKDEGKTFESQTRYKSLGTFELDVPVGRYESARYALVECEPLTGRRHQIRKHMKHFGHPVIGDTTHGDGDHNRFFKDSLGLDGLFLHAKELELKHTITGETHKISAPLPRHWRSFYKILDLARAGKCALYYSNPPRFVTLKNSSLQ